MKKNKKNIRVIGEVITQYYLDLTNHAYCRLKDLEEFKVKDIEEPRIKNLEECKIIVKKAFVAALKEQRVFNSKEEVVFFLICHINQGCDDFQIERQQIEQMKKLLFPKEYENYQITSEVLFAVQEDIEELPRQCRLIFKLFFCGLTPGAIAEIVEREVKTVENQKRIARDLLLNALRERGLLSL